MKNIVIFGANSAIAEATARQFASDDCALLLIARNSEKLQRLKNDFDIRYHCEVKTITADLADTTTHASLMQEVYKHFKTIDIALIAYGSLSHQKKCEENYSDTENELRINLLSPISLLTHLANKMELQKKGIIAVITSVAGDRGRQSNYVYGTAKGGLSIFLQGLRNRLHQSNVSVLTIKPGFVDTPMTENFKKGILWAEPDLVAKQIKNAIYKRRNILYTPRFWQYIMGAIKLMPENVFKKLKM